ncbi:MAG: WecB/TagA/CpsF family glycosyltransferase [Methylobacteriaceae bacterium]|nr:WecB/TagA/CpsF family glycosyltransferase [Methylobacteriaceae bacterium]
MLTQTNILGIPVQSGPVDEVVRHIDRRLAKQDVVRLAFLNAHLSNVCALDARRPVALDEFVVLNDGVGVDIARRVLHGAKFDHNLNGTDFVSALLERSDHDLKLFLLGARPDVIARAAETIGARWPRHRVVGAQHGFFTPAEEPGILSAIAAARPDVVLVGMGNPRQEQWLAAHVPAVCSCGIAVGAWFDFVAGAVPRAPTWLRSARLEWVFRLAIEPGRLWKRYLIGNAVFLARVAAARLGQSGPRLPA